MLPLGLIEQALRLVNNILEGTPIEIRRATAIAWWGIWESVIMATASKETQDRIRATLGVVELTGTKRPVPGEPKK
jgi:hypothetical protein